MIRYVVEIDMARDADRVTRANVITLGGQIVRDFHTVKDRTFAIVDLPDQESADRLCSSCFVVEVWPDLESGSVAEPIRN